MRTFFTPVYTLCGQSNTEVYLLDITPKADQLVLSNPRNISNNPGYDNQPSFYNDNILLFAGTRDDQTDIATYNLRDARMNWISDTQVGSEYSPTKIPNQKAISAIRLDTTGKQLLYRYDYVSGTSEVLLQDLVIAYHTWYSPDMIIASVIDGDHLSLVVADLKEGSHKTLQQKVGRSFHKIPNSKLVSYISKATDTWSIQSLDPNSGATQKIVSTLPESEDLCWLINGTILMGKGNRIYKFDPKTDTNWQVLYTFTDPNIKKITRIATNATSTLLAVVIE